MKRCFLFFGKILSYMEKIKKLSADIAERIIRTKRKRIASGIGNIQFPVADTDRIGSGRCRTEMGRRSIFYLLININPIKR